jgi:hypothetical protein
VGVHCPIEAGKVDCLLRANFAGDFADIYPHLYLPNMRYVHFASLLLIAGLSTFFLSCTKSKTPNTVDAVDVAPTYNEGRYAVGYKYNTAFNLTTDTKLFKNLLTKALLVQHPNLEAVMPDKIISTDTAAWKNVRLLVLGKETQYLVGRLDIQDTSRYTVAIELEHDPVNDSLYYVNTTEVHVCAGSTCPDCDFLKTPEGRITGCVCSGSTQSPKAQNGCTHSKTEHSAMKR